MRNVFIALALFLSAISESGAQITVDDYPVTDNMFKVEFASRPLKIGQAISQEYWWFKNDSLHESLIFNLAADLFRYKIFHFKNDDIPDGLIHEIDLQRLYPKKGYMRLQDSAKARYLPMFIDQATNIGAQYFTSQKGLKLGMNRQKAEIIYGVPDTMFTSNDYKVLSWKFPPDPKFNKLKPVQESIYAENSFGYNVTMYFKDEELVGMILVNDIP
jgi:hypothetical protein